MWQARHVSDLLRSAGFPSVSLVEIETAGDQVRDRPLEQIGGEGVFTKEIQRALLDFRIDVAVHSLKDLPTVPVEGLTLAAVPERGRTGDALVSRRYRRFDDLPRGAVVATGSPRRRSQLLQRRPDLKIVNIRGNVETRLRKLEEDNLDAVILAQAGLERLGKQDQISEILDPSWMLPAVGQGALGLECALELRSVVSILARLDHPPTRQAVTAERALLLHLGGGCHVPIGALGIVHEDKLSLHGVVLDADGKRRIEAQLSGPADSAEQLGRLLASELMDQGAKALLAGPGDGSIGP